MSKLSDRLNSIASKPTTPCPVGKLLIEFDPETAEALRNALNGRVPARAICTELAADGIRIGRDTIGAHRNGYCRCKAAEQ